MNGRKENWYDIFVLSEERNKETIERFLQTFADRDKIESRKREIIIVIPNIDRKEKDKVFKQFSISKREARYSSFNNLSSDSEYPLEYIYINSLTEGIDAALEKSERAYSLYIRNYCRNDVNCLILHFTLDQKVIFGISVAALDHQGDDNLPMARNLQKDIEELMPVKYSYVALETYAADDEVKFIENKKYWDERLQPGWDETGQVLRQHHYLNGFEFDKGWYYSSFRQRQHQRYRKMKGKVVYNINYSN